MASNKATRIPTKVHARNGQDRDPPVRVPFGLGQTPSPEAATRCLKCGFGNVPVVEEIVWTVPLPISHQATQATFGDTISMASNTPPQGVCSVDSTYLINGILTDDLYVSGIGVHVFVEPLTFAAIGNGWLAPALPVAPPPSPDVWGADDANNGSLGGLLPTGGLVQAGAAFPLVPASIDWGNCAWDAGWNFINAYQLQLRTNSRELMINEMLADVAYFASFGDALAAGTSEVAVIEYAALVNEQYRAQCCAPVPASIFLPANFRRYGSVGSTPGATKGLFHMTRDFDFAPVTHGGIRFQGTSCRGGMYRQIEKPCFIERGIPFIPLMVAVDPCHQARFQAAISIDSFTGSQNLQPDVNTFGYTLATAAGPLEQTLDLVTPANVQQSTTVERQVYKGGIFKLAFKVKGWYMPAIWKSWCAKNLPQVLAGSVAPGSAALATQ